MAFQVASAGFLGSVVQSVSSTALTDIETALLNLQNVLTGSGEKADKLLQKLKYKSSNPEGIQGLVKEINMAISQAVPANTTADLTQCFDEGKPSISDMVHKAGKNPLGLRTVWTEFPKIRTLHAGSIFKVEFHWVRECLRFGSTRSMKRRNGAAGFDPGIKATVHS
jgi:hypothetical protein